ncbi:pyruvate kinase [Metabacillus sp. 84]|uniref:pyruvate kinase n=1 Tax=unclassified Metabacillus TaxID=2675274 RepID=UPI003CEC06EE
MDFDIQKERIFSLASLREYLMTRTTERKEIQNPEGKKQKYSIAESDEIVKTKLKSKRAKALLQHDGHAVMATMDKSMQESYIAKLLVSGMTAARINCGHDGVKEWKEIISRLKRAAEMTNIHTCKIYMDLSGPKIRIIGLPNGLQQMKIHKGQTIRIALNQSHMADSFITNMPKAFQNAKKGDRLLINDGTIQAAIIYIEKEMVIAELVKGHKESFSIKVNDGINLPDSLTFLSLPAMSEQDIKESAFTFKHADIVGLSFVHSAGDLRALKNLMLQKTGKVLPVTAKIETEYAIKNLPAIISEGLKHKGFGIMAARGDLAVEAGFESLGRLQEEIMNVCHHSQTPLIYATEVLSTLAKTGMPKRPEIIDAYLSHQTACTMLNKGPFIPEAISMLKRIGTDRKRKLSFYTAGLLED